MPRRSARGPALAAGSSPSQRPTPPRPPACRLDTIVSGNTGGAAATPDNLGGVAPADSIGNQVGSGAVSLDPAYNQVGVDDPMLGPLQDNGGPTFTMAPLPGSPAIDAGF